MPILLLIAAYASCDECCSAGGSCAHAYKQTVGVCCSHAGAGASICCPASHRCAPACARETSRCFLPNTIPDGCESQSSYGGTMLMFFLLCVLCAATSWHSHKMEEVPVVVAAPVANTGLSTTPLAQAVRVDAAHARTHNEGAWTGFAAGLLLGEVLSDDILPSYADVGVEADH